ncbi:hypothetical protein PY093_04455 [Cytobacillus sp. S13-E01]|uniref:hypothetical protein n=1 Tax=Cytobacillus sp. S13-E01 TaxID=3031326 RepID=UPI0023D88B1F|nr:hypothetical protein [Cytobacillus sp. S13-E01]MDF0725963.1 hypothetical protein [Cytobacillus sp. S13-E01]
MLRDEGGMYANRLEWDGVETLCKRTDGVNHGFLNRFYKIDESKEIFQLIAEFLNQKE